jgi:hypothetical protein
VIEKFVKKDPTDVSPDVKRMFLVCSLLSLSLSLSLVGQ